MRQEELKYSILMVLAISLFVCWPFLPALAGNKEKANFYFAKGVKAAEAGDPEEAKEQFRQALKLYPVHEGAMVALGQLLNQEDDVVGLTELYSDCLKALKKTKPTPEQVKISEGLNTALVLLEELNKIDKQYSKKFTSLARSRKRKDEGMSIEACERALQLDLTNSTAIKLYKRITGGDYIPKQRPGLVAYWKFDETSGTTAQDSSGNKLHGKIRGAERVVGKVGDALSFNGVSNYVSTIPPPIGPQQSFTYEMWILVERYTAGSIYSGDGSYFLDRTAGAPLVSLKAANNQFGFQMRYDDDTGLGGPLGGIILIGKWVHIAMVRDYDTAFRLYVNGTLVGSSSDSGKSLTPPPLKIGLHAEFNKGLDGKIDEVKIYNRVLSAAEIKANYKKTK